MQNIVESLAFKKSRPPPRAQTHQNLLNIDLFLSSKKTCRFGKSIVKIVSLVYTIFCGTRYVKIPSYRVVEVSRYLRSRFNSDQPAISYSMIIYLCTQLITGKVMYMRLAILTILFPNPQELLELKLDATTYRFW